MSGTEARVNRNPRSPLMYVLAGVFLLFIGILVFVYRVTSKTHPVYVDEHGNPTNTQTGQQTSGGGHHP